MFFFYLFILVDELEDLRRFSLMLLRESYPGIIRTHRTVSGPPFIPFELWHNQGFCLPLKSPRAICWVTNPQPVSLEAIMLASTLQLAPNFEGFFFNVHRLHRLSIDWLPFLNIRIELGTLLKQAHQ